MEDAYIHKKIIMFDVDNTLTESKSVIDDEMKSLLEKLLRKKKVGIISGGSLKQIGFQIWDHLDACLLENLYILPANGSSLFSYDAIKKKWMSQYEETLSIEQKQQISNAYHVSISELHMTHAEKIYGSIQEDRGSQITFSALGQDAPADIKKMWDRDQKKRVAIVQKMQALAPQFSYGIGGLTSIDVTAKNIDKAHGAERLLEYLHLFKNDALYIGDALFAGGNDYSMKEAGYDCVKVADPKETKKIINAIL